jgi:hypothetical protein
MDRPMLPGDVALFRPNTLVGHTISVITTSRYCHARLIVDTDGNTVEADFAPGAKPGHVEDGDLVLSPPLTPDERDKVPAVASALIGIPYGWRDVFALGLAQFGLRLPSLSRQVSRPDRLFCSQLVDLVWRAVGFQAFTDGRLPQNVSPGDIADLALCSGWAAHVVQERTPTR